MIEKRECGCRTVTDGCGSIVSVDTCPRCLPVGAIEWLIENGRQLELLEEEGVTPVVSGVTGNEKFAQDPSEVLAELRLSDPSF